MDSLERLMIKPVPLHRYPERMSDNFYEAVRGFVRLGLVSPNATIDEVIYRARSLYPDFPGLLDLPAWDIGRKWCRPGLPLCGNCYMQQVCPTAIAHSSIIATP